MILILFPRKNRAEDVLQHYGVKRKSGRYPWGSGEDPYQSEPWYKFNTTYHNLLGQGLSEKEISTRMGMTMIELRQTISQTNRDKRLFILNTSKKLSEQGWSKTDIANKLGVSARTVDRYLSKENNFSAKSWDNVEKTIITNMEKTGILDISKGVEHQLGIPRTRFLAIVNKIAKEQGLSTHEVYVRRITDNTEGPSKWTTVKVLSTEPDIKKIQEMRNQIRSIEGWSDDGGLTIKNIKDPEVVSSDRIHIRYVEEGGADKDGVIELRPGVKDLDLGVSKYAQVRVATDGDLYLKGMAIYSDPKDFPKGKDIIYNVVKEKGTPADKVFKKMDRNSDNVFTTTIVRQKGAINVVNEEGDWDQWAGKISSQFLSKQPASLVKDRLEATYSQLQSEYDEINSLTNDVVKTHLLQEFSDGLDSKARHLKAQGLPRTKSHVLLPSNDIEPNEIYAPNYRDGEQVVLVRHPHGGRFEIPSLKVNNKNKSGENIIGSGSPDAVVIHPSVASKLSGADFDGDTVIVIPNNKGHVKHDRSLKDLKNFDPNIYKVNEPTMSDRTKQTQMGIVSNLITDMSIKDATPSELARAVRHSMVVIDAEKHQLDYKQSAIDNGISELRRKYQQHINPDTGKTVYGGSTIVSRSKKKMNISDPEFNPDKYSSGTVVENLYSDYVKKLQGLKNEATKVLASAPEFKYNRESAKVYVEEVKSLNDKLIKAELNAPRERQAQILSNKLYLESLTPEMDKDKRSKLASRSLARARETVGAKKEYIQITDNEWEAIQAGAISKTKLKDILNNAEANSVKKLATPRQNELSVSKETKARTLLDKGYTPSQVAESIGARTSDITNLTLSEAKISRAKTLIGRGLTYEEVAKALGVSTTTISKAMKG